MARKGYILATHEIEHTDTGGIISSTDLRIHYLYSPGSPDVPYLRNGDPGYPGWGPEIELDFVEHEAGGKWERVPVDDGLWLWADSYLEKHSEDVDSDVADAAIIDAEYAAEMRADR